MYFICFSLKTQVLLFFTKSRQVEKTLPKLGVLHNLLYLLTNKKMEEKSFKILVVETDANFNKTISVWLSKEKEFNTLSVYTFDMARATLAESDFDLVIINKDLSYVEMMGYSLLPFIYEKSKVVFIGEGGFNDNLKNHRRINILLEKSEILGKIIPEVRGLLGS